MQLSDAVDVDRVAREAKWNAEQKAKADAQAAAAAKEAADAAAAQAAAEEEKKKGKEDKNSKDVDKKEKANAKLPPPSNGTYLSSLSLSPLHPSQSPGITFISWHTQIRFSLLSRNT